jgi:hypothetical protein
MFGEEKGRPPIGAGGDELQLSRAVSALVKRHTLGEYTLGKSLPQDAPFGRSQTSKIRGLRQPASSLGQCGVVLELRGLYTRNRRRPAELQITSALIVVADLGSIRPLILVGESRNQTEGYVTSSKVGFLPQFRCLTPLYHFASDTSELVIDPGIRFCRFGEPLSIQIDDAIAKHLRVHDPDYLLWNDPLLSQEIPDDDLLLLFVEQKCTELTALFLAATTELIMLLRLFKPGHLRAGETFIVFRDKSDDRGSWTTLASGRASGMVVDYSVLAALQTPSYVLQSAEIPFLLAFREHLLPVLRKLSSFATTEMALGFYAADNGPELDVVGAITALEALLTKENENEGLTYRLSMRVANLLGSDAQDRKAIFEDVKKFYKLRSRIVHGAGLDPKLRNKLGERDSLRETLRRVLLSVMALFSEGVRPIELPGQLDDLAFDEEKRKHVLATAAKFLHISAKQA